MKKLVKILVLICMFFGSFSFVNADTSYIYYYGNGCPHCAKVDEYMTGVNAYKSGKIAIEKREVWANKDNAKMMDEDSKRLGVPEGKGGVPFLIINENGSESYLIGDGPIIDYFIPILGEPAPLDNTKKYIAFAIILLIGGGIGFMVMRGNK